MKKPASALLFGDTARVRRFESHLRRSRLSPVAITHYLAAVRRGLETGEMLVSLREAQSPSAAKLARAGLLRWARWHEDKALERRIPKVPYVRAVARRARLDEATRDRILTQIGRDLPAREYAGARLSLNSELRIADIFSAPRSSVLSWPIVKGSHLLPVTLAHESWSTIGDLLAVGGPNAAYAALRRIVLRACSKLDIPSVRLHEFRVLALKLASDTEEKE